MAIRRENIYKGQMDTKNEINIRLFHFQADGDVNSKKNGHINEVVNNNVDNTTTKRSGKAKLT